MERSIILVVGNGVGPSLLTTPPDAWAKGLQFHVGDNLVFKYQRGGHTVIKVDGDGFRGCTPAVGAEVFATGKDVITLSTPGKKWYICGISVHCSLGNQKLEINVLSQVQAPESSATFGAQPPVRSIGNRKGVAGFYEKFFAHSKSQSIGSKIRRWISILEKIGGEN